MKIGTKIIFYDCVNNGVYELVSELNDDNIFKVFNVTVKHLKSNNLYGCSKNSLQKQYCTTNPVIVYKVEKLFK